VSSLPLPRIQSTRRTQRPLLEKPPARTQQATAQALALLVGVSLESPVWCFLFLFFFFRTAASFPNHQSNHTTGWTDSDYVLLRDATMLTIQWLFYSEQQQQKE